MAEANSTHLREIEMAALKSAADENKRGQIFGLIIGLAVLVACITALAMGYKDVAAILGGTTIVGLVTVFVTGRFVTPNKKGPDI